MPPLILVLDEARVRPAQHDSGELVRCAMVDDVADVERGRCAGVLRDADRLAVDEHAEHALRAAELEHDRS